MAATILFIEDDPNIRSSLGMFLRHEGYTVVESSSGEDGLAAFARSASDLVLVDLLLPGVHGFEVTRELRRSSDVPVVIVTACADTHDVVAGLEAGADDYLTKPVVAKELSARIRALLRRAHSRSQEPPRLTFGDLELHIGAGEVRKAGRDISLTRTEFRLLCELARSPGWILSREQLLKRVWDYDYLGDSRIVDVHIGRLRAKIEDDPGDPVLILTVRGLGYKLQP